MASFAWGSFLVFIFVPTLLLRNMEEEKKGEGKEEWEERDVGIVDEADRRAAS